MRMPILGDSLSVTRNSTMNDGIWVSFEFPVVRREVRIPGWSLSCLGHGRLGTEEGTEEVVRCSQLGRR